MPTRKSKRKGSTRSPWVSGTLIQRVRGGRWLVLLGAALVGVHLTAGLTVSGGTSAAAAEVTVWKSPTCGCCGKWIEHMRGAGFSVDVRDTEAMDGIKAANGVPDEHQSCHTAVVDGYVVEGHVPAADVRKLLAERPLAKGVSVPGMPQSAPGMDIPGQSYDVMLFGGDKESRVYARH